MENNEIMYPENLKPLDLEEEITKQDIIEKTSNHLDYIKNNEFFKIDAREIKELFDLVEALKDEGMKNDLYFRVSKIKGIIIDDRNNLDNNKLNNVYDELEKIKEIVNLTLVKRKNNEQAYQNKKNVYKIAEEHAHFYNRDKDEATYINFLSSLMNKYNERVYTDEAIEEMSFAEKQELYETYQRLMGNEIKNDKPTEENKNIPKGNEESVIDKLNEVIASIDENMTKEELDDLLKKAFKDMVAYYKDDIDNLIKSFYSADTLEEKVEIGKEILKLNETTIVKYEELDEVTRDLVNKYLIETIREEYNLTDYPFINIIDIIKAQEILSKQPELNSIIEKLDELLKEPTQENYVMWQTLIKDFFKANDIDLDLMLIYINAKLKMKDEKLHINEEFEISGLMIINKGTYGNGLEDTIKMLIDQINIETSENVIKMQMESVNNLLLNLYAKDKKEFIDALKNSKNVDSKLEVIDEFESRIEYYAELLTHKDKSVDSKIEKYREDVLKAIKATYAQEKQNGEYTWANYETIKASREYINTTLSDEEKVKFNVLIEKMYDIIKNPSKEKHDEWQKEMKEFANKNNLESDKMTPYMTACAKMRNNKLEVTNEFEIKGLNFEKKRKKVTKVSKIKDFFKKHPKIKILATGLAILLASQLGLSALMMINSTAWLALGGSGSVCHSLHLINMALSKLTGFGMFKFTSAGTYTLLGQPGALPLYSAVGAKLTTAALGLTGGAVIAKKIKDGITSLKKPVLGPLTDEEKDLFEGNIIANSKDENANRNLLCPTDSNERKIERSINYMRKKDLPEGTYVVNTKLARELLNNYKTKNEEQEEKVEPIEEHKPIEETEKTTTLAELKELVERLKTAEKENENLRRIIEENGLENPELENEYNGPRM